MAKNKLLKKIGKVAKEKAGELAGEYVDKAKREESTILATIVGEKPAQVPENIGVFVVENGELND